MRIAARIVIFALIGAAATVLVAWSVSQRVMGMTGELVSEKYPRMPWPERVPEGWPPDGRPQRLARAWCGELETWSRDDIADEFPAGFYFNLRRARCGWPAASLGGSTRWVVQDDPNQPTVKSTSSVWHAVAVPSSDSKGVFPLAPLWPGFAVDTAFWGGAAFVVWSVPGFVRRRARRRRGRCVRCGYELLAGVAVCPECGS